MLTVVPFLARQLPRRRRHDRMQGLHQRLFLQGGLVGSAAVPKGPIRQRYRPLRCVPMPGVQRWPRVPHGLHCTDAMLTRIDQRCYRSRRVHTVRGRLLCIVNRCHSLPTVFNWVVLSNRLDDAQALSCGQIQQHPGPHVRRAVSRDRTRLLGAHWLIASGAMPGDWVHLPRGTGGQDERGAWFEADHRQHWWAD